MKINLLLDNPNGALPGYLNIDPFAQPENDSRQKGPIDNLDWGIDNNEIEEIRICDITDYFPLTHLQQIFDNWINKLAVGGKIVVSGVDLNEICRQMTFDLIDRITALKLIYGEQNKKWNIKQSCLSILDIITILEKKNIQISLKLLDGYKYIVEGIKQ